MRKNHLLTVLMAMALLVSCKKDEDKGPIPVSYTHLDVYKRQFQSTWKYKNRIWHYVRGLCPGVCERLGDHAFIGSKIQKNRLVKIQFTNPGSTY